MVDKIMVPQRYLCSHPETCECVNLHSKSDFAGVIKFSILSWKDIPGFSGWAQPYKGSSKKKAPVKEKVRGWKQRLEA